MCELRDFEAIPTYLSMQLDFCQLCFLSNQDYIKFVFRTLFLSNQVYCGAPGTEDFFYYDETVGNGKQSWCFISIWSTFFMHHSEWIGSPSNSFSSNVVDDVPKEVKGQLKDLKEVAEGDAEPKGKTTSQCVEQASILKFESWKLSSHPNLS